MTITQIAPPGTAAAALEQEMRHQPTDILTDQGLEPITEKPSAPSPIMIALLEEPVMLFTGLEWMELNLAAKIDIMVSIGAPPDPDDILSALPEQSLKWLAGWQMQVNSNNCWNTAGSIGRQAHELLQDGYILWGPAATKGFYGQTIPGRGDVRAGAPGSAAYVRTMMGERYLAWVSAIE